MILVIQVCQLSAYADIMTWQTPLALCWVNDHLRWARQIEQLSWVKGGHQGTVGLPIGDKLQLIHHLSLGGHITARRHHHVIRLYFFRWGWFCIIWDSCGANNIPFTSFITYNDVILSHNSCGDYLCMYTIITQALILKSGIILQLTVIICRPLNILVWEFLKEKKSLLLMLRSFWIENNHLINFSILSWEYFYPRYI